MCRVFLIETSLSSEEVSLKLGLILNTLKYHYYHLRPEGKFLNSGDA